MALDPTIPLDVQTPQISLGAILQQAMQLKQMQQQAQQGNALKAIFAQPDAIDQKTGRPTTNALAQAMRVSPEFGMKMISENAEADQRAAATAHDQSETQVQQGKRYQDEMGAALRAYDAEMASGDVPQDIAERNMRQSLADQIDGLSIDQKEKDRLKGLAVNTPIPQLRAYTMTAEQAEKQKELTEERTPYLMDGRTVFLDKEGHAFDADGKPTQITGTIERPEAAFDPARAAASADNRAPQLLTDPKTSTQYWAYPGPAGRAPIYKDLNGAPYTPSGAQHISSGVARSAAALATQKYMEEHPDASAQDIADFAGRYKATVTAGGAVAGAEAAGLTNLTKMRDSVSQAEGNARKETGLVESLLDKGGLPGGPSAFGKWVQGGRTGVFNDPDASALNTAVESLKNEYVKVLSTTGGMSGGMSSDAARREADQYINPRLSKEQIKANIAVMKRSMQNRTDAINEAITTAQARVKESAPGGERKAAALPSDLPSPKGHADGTRARDKSGNVVAVIRNGQWVSPS